jgi:hypothetical protein
MLFRLSKVRSPGRGNELGANFVAVPPGHLALALPDDTVGGKEQYKFIGYGVTMPAPLKIGTLNDRRQLI